MGLELTLAWSLGLAAVWWLGGGAAPSLKTSRDLAPFVAVLGLAVIDTPAVWSGLWAVGCVAVALQPRGGGRRHSATSGWIAVGALFVIAGARADAPEAADFAALLTTSGLALAAILLTRSERSSAWTSAEWALAAGLLTAAVRGSVGELPIAGPWFRPGPSSVDLTTVAGASLAAVMVHGCARPSSGRLPMLAAVWAGGLSAPWEAWALGVVGMTLGMRRADGVADPAGWGERAGAYLVRGAAVFGLLAAASVVSRASTYDFVVVAGGVACAVWGVLTVWAGDSASARRGESTAGIAAVDHAMRRVAAGSWATLRGMGSALDLGLWTPLRAEGAEVVRRGARRAGEFFEHGSPTRPGLARFFSAFGFALVLGWLMLKPTASSILPDDVFNFGGLHPELRGTGARKSAARSGGDGATR